MNGGTNRSTEQDTVMDDSTATLPNQRQRLRLLQRQLVMALQMQQLEFQKFILQPPPPPRNIRRTMEDHHETSLHELRQRYHQVQQLHSCYQEYDAILQVLCQSNSNQSTSTSTTTLNRLPVVTAAINTAMPPPPLQQQQQPDASVRNTSTSRQNHHTSSRSNDALQMTYQQLLRDKQTIHDQIVHRQQQEIQLRKQQLHLLLQTIQDMKHPPIHIQK